MIIDLWRDCRGGGGVVLPFAGGAAEQPPLVMAAFRVIDDTLARLRRRAEGHRG